MKDDGRIPRIEDTDMTDRLLTAGAIAEDTRNPIGDIAACFPGHGSQSVGMFHGCLSGFPKPGRSSPGPTTCTRNGTANAFPRRSVPAGTTV